MNYWKFQIVLNWKSFLSVTGNTAVAAFILRLPHSKVGYTGELPLSQNRHYDSIFMQLNFN